LKTAEFSMDRFLQRRMASNSFMGAVRFFIVSATYLLVYPLLLKQLEPRQFGLWALLCVPSQYVALGDFGISTAIIKLVSEGHPGEERERTLQLASAGTVTFSMLGGLLTIIVWLLADSIPSWLRIGPDLVPEARILLIGMAMVIWMTLMGNVYTALLSGMHRMDWAHAVQIGGSVLNAVGIVVSLRIRAGLTGLMLCNVFSALAVWVAALCLARRGTGISWRWLPRTTISAVRSILGFGACISVAAFASLLMEPAVKVLLARYGSIEYVSSFELASRIVTQSRSLFHFAMLPLLPAASLLMSDRERARTLYSRAMRLLFLTAVPAYLSLFILAVPIVHLWLGRDVPFVQGALAVLSIGWLLNILTLPAFLMVQGMNWPRYAMWCAVIQGVICVFGGYLLIPRIGFSGAIYSETAGLIIAATYIQVQFTKICPATIEDATANPLGRLIAILVLFALALFGIGRLSPSVPGWLWGALSLVSMGLYGFALYRKKVSNFTAIDLLRYSLLSAPREAKGLTVLNVREGFVGKES
jgi:O-antigen/teichoic acid export membrane protein